MNNPLKKFFESKLKLVKGTRFVSLLFIGTSVLIAAGILFAANMYYNIDTGEIVMEEIQRVTGTLRATASLIVGGASDQDPEAGVSLEIASDDVLLSAANQVLRFSGGTEYYIGFKAPTDLATTTAYTWPGTYPGASGQVLQSTDVGALSWLDLGEAGYGDITAVGDVSSGAAFTQGTATGTSLWFHRSGQTGKLTVAASLGADRTYTLPDASGTLALGTGTTGYAAYWSATNTLGVEQYLSVIRGGTGAGSFTQYGIIYGNNTGALGTTATGTQYQILTSEGGTSAPAWRNISNLLTEGNNINLSGTTNVTIATVMDPTFTLSVTSPQFLSTTTLAIMSGNGQDITIDSASGRILLGSANWIETASGYKIGATSTEILREMIPILGFDLPVRTATSGTVQISRTIENYPVSSCAAGTSRIHKLVIRYGSVGTTTWAVATSTTGTYTPFELPPTNSTTTGTVHTATTDIPTPSGACTGWIQNSATDDWWVRVSPNSKDTMIYQIFLAAYDEIQ